MGDRWMVAHPRRRSYCGGSKCPEALLKHILGGTGDKLSGGDLKAAMKSAGSGDIDYAKFVKSVFAGVPAAPAATGGGGGGSSKPKAAKAAPKAAPKAAAPAPADDFGGDGFGDDDDDDDFGF